MNFKLFYTCFFLVYMVKNGVLFNEIENIASQTNLLSLNASIKEVEVGNQITDVVQSNSATAQAISLSDLVEEFSI